MNWLLHKQIEHTDHNFIQGTKRNSTRPNSLVQPQASSYHSSQSCQVGYCDSLIHRDHQPNKRQKTKDQITIKGETLQIDYLNEESVLSVLVKINKTQTIKEKTRICLQMIILNQGLAHNKKLSSLFQSYAKQYQEWLLEEIV